MSDLIERLNYRINHMDQHAEADLCELLDDSLTALEQSATDYSLLSADFNSIAQHNHYCSAIVISLKSENARLQSELDAVKTDLGDSERALVIALAANAGLQAELDALKLEAKDKILISRVMAEDLRDYYQVEAQQYIDWHRPEKAESYLADAAILTAQLYQGDSAEWLWLD